MSAQPSSSGQANAINPGPIITTSPNTPDLAFLVERDTDLVQLDFSFFGGWSIDSSGPVPAIAADPTAWQAYVVVQFPPQALGEAVYDYGKPVDRPPVLSALSGPSRVVFVPPAGTRIPLTTGNVSDLLDWVRAWPLKVPPTATTAAQDVHSIAPGPGQPADSETAIEAPLDLYLSPLDDCGFAVEPAPVVQNGIVEVWRAELIGTTAGNTRVAVVWARDYTPHPVPPSPQMDPTNATPEIKLDFDPASS